jgi:hypothetical protein
MDLESHKAQCNNIIDKSQHNYHLLIIVGSKFYHQYMTILDLLYCLNQSINSQNIMINKSTIINDNYIY